MVLAFLQVLDGNINNYFILKNKSVNCHIVACWRICSGLYCYPFSASVWSRVHRIYAAAHFTLRVNLICCQTEEQHLHLGVQTRSENSFLCLATLWNHLFVEDHIPFIHVNANHAKFNTSCLLPWIWDTEQTTESVAEKQQRSFHCQTARVSGTVYRLSVKHSQKSN